MKVIDVHELTLDLPILSVHARSFRKTLLNISTGGRLLKDGRDKVYVRALDRVSFSLEEGDRLGLIGHNGSGKSSLLRTLGGIYKPSSGQVEVTGRVATILDPATGLNPDATGRENIGLLARYGGHPRAEIEAAMDEIASFTELGSFLDVPLKTYSAGMVARLTFSVGTHWCPDVLLLDEWIAVADETFKASALQRLTNVMARARSVVLATHDKTLLGRLCNKVLVLEHGQISYFGPTQGALLMAA